MTIKFKNAYLKYRKGFRTNRKIIVLESDDWGSIRMPSLKVREELCKRHPVILSNPYMRVDSLESSEDIEALFEVLSKFKDKKNNTPVLTANVVLGNPDFQSIQKANFSKFFHQNVSDTHLEYFGNTKAIDLWKSGLESNLMFPQYHGREHLNVDQWMQALQTGNPEVKMAFNKRMISISGLKTHMKYDFMESLDFFNEEEKRSKYSILEDGLNQFEELFGLRSESFIANCYVWDSHIESVLKMLGVNYLQGNLYQLNPTIENNQHYYNFKPHYLGEIGEYNQAFLIRNAHFEPAFSPGIDVISRTFRQICWAFYFQKPAIISSHRLNYIGGIDESNRTHNLFQLEKLIGMILKKWPEVEFMTSVELGNIVSGSKYLDNDNTSN